MDFHIHSNSFILNSYIRVKGDVVAHLLYRVPHLLSTKLKILLHRHQNLKSQPHQYNRDKVYLYVYELVHIHDEGDHGEV